MVYLMVFLTLLIGILTYGMDPSPKRLEEDTRMAESLVLSFLNQHQAAKDYMYHWMWHWNGSSDSLSLNTEDDRGNTQTDQFQINFNSTAGGGLANILTSDQMVNDVAVDMHHYASAYVCLENGNLANCNHAATAGVKKRQYVITYGSRPNWWADADESLTRREVWRRAFTNRTRGSYNCGTLMKAGHGLVWCHKRGSNNVEAAASCGFQEESSEYCIDNGTRCMTVVPSGITAFLQNHAGIAGDLSDILLCMSPMKNEYVSSGLVFFYDGIDNSAMGPEGPGVAERMHDNQRLWANQVSTGSYPALHNSNINWTANFPGIVLNGNQTIPLVDDINNNLYRNNEFTLEILMRPASKVSGYAMFLGPSSVSANAVADGVDIAFGYRGNNCTVGSGVVAGADCYELMLSNGTVAPFTFFEASTTDSNPPNTKLHSWTFVRRKGIDQDTREHTDNLYVYVDGGPWCDADDASKVWVVPYPNNNAMDEKPMELGGMGSERYIMAVRGYNRALSPQEIKHNYHLDVKRYGLGEWIGISRGSTQYRGCETNAIQRYNDITR